MIDNFCYLTAPKKVRRKSVVDSNKSDTRPGTPMALKPEKHDIHNQTESEKIARDTFSKEQKKYIKVKKDASHLTDKENVTHSLTTTPTKSNSQLSKDRNTAVIDTTVPDNTELSSQSNLRLHITPHRLSSNTDSNESKYSRDAEPQRPLVNSHSSAVTTQYSQPNQKSQFNGSPSSPEHRQYQQTEFDFRYNLSEC